MLESEQIEAEAEKFRDVYMKTLGRLSIRSLRASTETRCEDSVYREGLPKLKVAFAKDSTGSEYGSAEDKREALAARRMCLSAAGEALLIGMML